MIYRLVARLSDKYVENICNHWEVYIIGTVSIKDTKKKGIKIMAKKDTKKKINNVKPAENDIISLDNKPIASDVKKEKQEINKKFANVTPVKPIITNNTIKTRNGRVYRDLGNGIGMFADTGETFKI